MLEILCAPEPAGVFPGGRMRTRYGNQGWSPPRFLAATSSRTRLDLDRFPFGIFLIFSPHFEFTRQ